MKRPGTLRTKGRRLDVGNRKFAGLALTGSCAKCLICWIKEVIGICSLLFAIWLKDFGLFWVYIIDFEGWYIT